MAIAIFDSFVCFINLPRALRTGLYAIAVYDGCPRPLAFASYVPAFKAVIILDFEVMLGCHLVFF